MEPFLRKLVDAVTFGSIRIGTVERLAYRPLRFSDSPLPLPGVGLGAPPCQPT